MHDSAMTKQKLASELQQLRARLQELEGHVEAGVHSDQTAQRLSSLISSLPGGLLIETPQRNVIKANQTFCDLFDISRPPDSLAGLDGRQLAQNIKTLFQDGDGFLRRIDEILAAARPVQNEILALQDGRMLSRDYTPVDSGQGNVEHLWYYRDVTSRIRVEQALNETAARYYHTLDTMLEGCQIIGHDWKYLYANDAVCRQALLSRENLLGRTMMELYPGIEETAMFATLRRCMTERTSALLDNEFTFADGSSQWYQLSVQPVPEGIFILSNDITDRIRSQERMHKSEEHYRLLTENISDVLWVLDIESLRFRYVSPSVEHLRGYTVAEVMSQDISLILTPESLQRFVKLLPDRLREWQQGLAVPHIDQVDQPCKDGRIVCTESTTRFAVNPESGRLEVYGVSRDIMERKKAEQALRQSEQLLRTVIDSTPDFIFAKDRHLRYILANKSFADGISIPVEEIIGKNDVELGFPHELIFGDPTRGLRGYRNDDLHVLEQNTSLHVPYDPIRLADGKEIILDTLKVPLHNQKNEIWAVLGVGRDETARRHAEEGKAKLEEHLRRSQRLETIGTLAGGIAHEFNNILTPIMGYADMAFNGTVATDPVREDINHILHAARRARDLVEQILIFSREIEKERKPVSLHLIIREALQLLRPVLPVNIDIQQHIDESGGQVLADASQMHQVIINLCINGFHAMEEKGGTLTVALKQVTVDSAMAKACPNLSEGAYACLTVRDTGTGMTETTRDRIFEPFFTTKGIGKGTGLGLSVVHGIVKSHQGEIVVQSEFGKGSEFQVYLPIAPANIAAGEKVFEIEQGSETILLVDDDEQVVHVLSRMLERLGYRVNAFSSSLAALEAFRRQPGAYDLVISDVIMPAMTGLDLCEQLRGIHQAIPIIFMTGYGDNIPSAKQAQNAVQFIMVKPITLHELASTIRMALTKPSGG